MTTVPQIQPWIDAADADAVRAAVASTYVTEHERTREFERRLADYAGVSHAIAYCNATCGLFAVLKALGIGPGDEVLVPDLTFVATAGAVIQAGATPVFCDVDARTLMLTPATAAPHLSAQTRAIIPVHLYGMAADVAAFEPLAQSHGLHIIEDAAQAIGVRFQGRHAGAMGIAGVISFYGNKTMTTGEGGVILTNDARLAEEVYRLKNHGRLEKGVFVHDRIGFNFSFTEMQAALGLSQLVKLPRIIADKQRIRDRYMAGLTAAGVIQSNDAREREPNSAVEMQQPSDGVSPVYWFTNIFVDNAEALAADLAEQGIRTRRFFYPLHRQPCFAAMGSSVDESDFASANRAFRRGLSLPSACGLPDGAIDRITRALTDHIRRQGLARRASKPVHGQPVTQECAQ